MKAIGTGIKNIVVGTGEAVADGASAIGSGTKKVVVGTAKGVRRGSQAVGKDWLGA